MKKRNDLPARTRRRQGALDRLTFRPQDKDEERENYTKYLERKDAEQQALRRKLGLAL